MENIQESIRESLWMGYRRIDFLFRAKNAVLIFPKTVAPGAPWAQYTEYFDAFPCTALTLVQRGYHLASIENVTRWGNAADYEAKHAFGVYLAREYGLSRRSTLIGMSCGGMIAVHMAARYPDDVEALYLDAPVINLLSCPMAFGVTKRDQGLIDECLDALHMTVSQMLSFRGNPLDELSALTNARIPAIVVYGTADTTVPFIENGQLLVDAYRAADCPVKVFAKPGCAHHPHGLQDPAPVADLLEEWRVARMGASL